MGGNQRIASANRRLRVQNGSMKFGRFAGATRILGRMPAGVALVALGIRPPQSLVISGRGIAAAATARPMLVKGGAGPGYRGVVVDRRVQGPPRVPPRSGGMIWGAGGSEGRRGEVEPVGRVRTAQRAAEPFVAKEVSPVPPEPSTLQLFRTRAAHRAGTRQSPNSTAAERPAVDQI